GRTREAGIRGALGASRVAIFRGALIESGLLGAAGAVGGVIVALAGLEVFASIAGAGLPRAKAVELDGSALALIALLAAGSTVAFGLLPALRTTQVNPQRVLRAGGRSFTETRSEEHTSALQSRENP